MGHQGGTKWTGQNELSKVCVWGGVHTRGCELCSRYLIAFFAVSMCASGVGVCVVSAGGLYLLVEVLRTPNEEESSGLFVHR